jgi:thiosulfate reductase cytochrome b subunit
MANQRTVKSTIHWLLTVVVIMYLITGFGISEYRIVESLTFGLLTKSLAQKIHMNLEIPFIILLVSHIWLLPLLKRFRLKNLRSTIGDK